MSNTAVGILWAVRAGAKPRTVTQMAPAFLQPHEVGLWSAAMRLSTRIRLAVRAMIDFVRASRSLERRLAPVRVVARRHRFR